GTTGGTYLGSAGFLFDGPDQMLGAIPRSKNLEPKDGFHSDFGVKVGWTPVAGGGNFGFHFRQCRETEPWAPLIGVDAAGNTNYHLAYADRVKMVGVSYDTAIGAYSAGFEASYRRNTALASGTGPLPSDLSGREGARGDTLHLIANV